MSYLTKDLLLLVLTLILAVHAAPYSAVNHRHVGIVGNAVRSNNNQVRTFNTSIQNEPGRLDRRTDPDHPTWLLSRFNDLQTLTAADKKVFDSKLEKVKLGSQLPSHGGYNGGIWNVKSYKGYSGSPDDLLLKVIWPDQYGANNYGEVKALKQVGDFVASGHIKDPELSTLDKIKSKIKSKPPGDYYNAVIMKKKVGVTLRDPSAYADFSGLVKLVEELACKAAAEIAVVKGALHGDLNRGNILITMDQARQKPTSVNLVDWGIGNWVSKGVKEDEVYRYCLGRTKLRVMIGEKAPIANQGVAPPALQGVSYLHPLSSE
ncbi:hypothetical protein D9757_006020 [Collybiopsis confluens]|uniref:Protein kinase domain-containing protein n=1 Tax=Collybiopsis confluens TaxID=2823264 RepID=A0A8H5MDB0_9AGAR|nr:hypothetical protein D9757_006020 [Collybiopsis confluens]